MSKQNILLIGHDEDLMDRLKEFIETLPLQLNVMSVSNGLEAVMYICNHPRQSLLVILDLNMPVMDGVEFLEYVQCEQLMKYLDIAVLIGSDFTHDLGRVLPYQVKEFLLKPIELQQVAKLLHCDVAFAASA